MVVMNAGFVVSIERIETFRLSAIGGLDIHYTDSPIVRLSTDGTSNDSSRVAPLDALGLLKLSEYLRDYAERLHREHPYYCPELSKQFDG